MLRIMESMAEPMPKYLSGSVTITDLLFMDWNKPVPKPYWHKQHSKESAQQRNRMKEKQARR